MRPVHRILPVLAAVGLPLWVATVSAQQVTVGTPFHSLNNSFFENMGTNWSLQGQGWNASFGSPAMAQPPFGGFNAGAGLSFGFGILNQGVVGKFNFNFSQGNSQSNVSATPMVTLQNGVPGYFSDTTQSPFVISDIPIVGNPAVAQALQRARAQRVAMDDDDQAIGPSAAQAAVRRRPIQARPCRRRDRVLEPKPRRACPPSSLRSTTWCWPAGPMRPPPARRPRGSPGPPRAAPARPCPAWRKPAACTRPSSTRESPTAR